MIKHFLSLEWKSFYRSASFGKSLGVKLLMVFFALYLIVSFLAVGVALYPGLKKLFPEQDPLNSVNNYLFYWILGDLVFRFFFQKLPVMSVKPLLTLPIKRSKVVNFVLGKSALSFFNFLPLFAIVPFGITLLLNAYPSSSVLIWMLALGITTLIINYLNFIIESFSAETELSFLPVILFTGGFYALDYFNIISFTSIVASGYNAIYNSPYIIVVPILILGVLYVVNFKLLLKKLFLDSGLKTAVKEVNASNLEWTKNFGDIAPFMQLDLKLMWRNKRTKSSVWMLVIGLLYGLFIYPQPQFRDIEFFFIFIGIFSTGIFLMNFGQFVPAWDSSYYKLLMTQNIKYEQYLKSKFTLMALSVAVLFVLGIPYVYFGWKVLFAHFAGAIYNIGVNTHVILLGGSYNRKKINLDEKAAFNYQGTGAVQWLIGIPLLLLPMLIFGILNWLLSFEIACLVLIVMGVLGIVFHQKIMRFITGKYLASKYKMIAAFDQEN
ncbi:DUF5687 family protein [Algibacter sp. 2305UL17-15]|uniref:DUF5687 family protein n=1 Tax=Algibacter sp. 2305UL17-15 TaxID=3231268 RepID=UPI00345A0E1E